MGNSNRERSNDKESNDKQSPNPENDKFHINDKCKQSYEFIIQFFGKTSSIIVNEFEYLSLEEFKFLIFQELNFKKIPINRITLFYREPNRLNFKLVNSESFYKIKNGDIIKVKIFPEIISNNKEDYEKEIRNLITNIEIEDAVMDDYILRLKEAIINITPGNIEINQSISKIVEEINTEDKSFQKYSNKNEKLIMMLFSKVLETRGIKT